MAGVAAIKAKLVGELKSRGARGIIGLGRKFRIMESKRTLPDMQQIPCVPPMHIMITPPDSDTDTLCG